MPVESVFWPSCAVQAGRRRPRAAQGRPAPPARLSCGRRGPAFPACRQVAAGRHQAAGIRRCRAAVARPTPPTRRRRQAVCQGGFEVASTNTSTRINEGGRWQSACRVAVVAEVGSLPSSHRFMNTDTKQLLTRWQSLEKDGGLQRAASTARALWLVRLVLCIFVVFAVIYRLHPALVAVAAAAMSWVIAERNALRTRLAQWPIFKTYIDWKQVEEDLRG